MTGLARYALTIGAAAALLVGCGGGQSPIGAGAVRQSPALPSVVNRSGAWMAPEAKNEDLMYVDRAGAKPTMSIFAYPSGKLVGTFNGPSLGGLCSDAQGNVYAPSASTEQMLEYAHGATSPFNTLTVPGDPYDCSVDPTTGNLAVLWESPSGKLWGVAIYQNATGSPTVYETFGIYCGYDGYGNLFVDNTSNPQTFILSELVKGTNAFVNISVAQVVQNPGQLQWDGRYITVQDQNPPGSIYRLSVSGSAATVVGKTRFRHIRKFDSQSWIWNGMVAIGIKKAYGWAVEIWKYPAGRNAIETLQGNFGKGYAVYGITVSRAPRR